MAGTKRMIDRNQQMHDAYQGGASLASLARAHGMSPKNAASIVWKTRVFVNLKKSAPFEGWELLSCRARNVLTNQCIDSVEKLIGLHYNDVAQFSMCGKKTLAEIMRFRAGFAGIVD